MGVARDQIAQKVVKISGFSESRVLALLPSEYKQMEKAVSPGRPRSTPEPVIPQKQNAERETVKGKLEQVEPVEPAIGLAESSTSSAGTSKDEAAISAAASVNIANGSVARESVQQRVMGSAYDLEFT